jgi:hypothetical protein
MTTYGAPPNGSPIRSKTHKLTETAPDRVNSGPSCPNARPDVLSGAVGRIQRLDSECRSGVFLRLLMGRERPDQCVRTDLKQRTPEPPLPSIDYAEGHLLAPRFHNEV